MCPKGNLPIAHLINPRFYDVSSYFLNDSVSNFRTNLFLPVHEDSRNFALILLEPGRSHNIYLFTKLNT